MDIRRNITFSRFPKTLCWVLKQHDVEPKKDWGIFPPTFIASLLPHGPHVIEEYVIFSTFKQILLRFFHV